MLMRDAVFIFLISTYLSTFALPHVSSGVDSIATRMTESCLDAFKDVIAAEIAHTQHVTAETEQTDYRTVETIEGTFQLTQTCTIEEFCVTEIDETACKQSITAVMEVVENILNKFSKCGSDECVVAGLRNLDSTPPSWNGIPKSLQNRIIAVRTSSCGGKICVRHEEASCGNGRWREVRYGGEGKISVSEMTPEE